MQTTSGPERPGGPQICEGCQPQDDPTLHVTATHQCVEIIEGWPFCDCACNAEARKHLRKLRPTHACIVTGHDHMMMQCQLSSCKRNGTVHMYCPERNNPHPTLTRAENRTNRPQPRGRKG